MRSIAPMTITQALLGFAVVAALLTIMPGIDSALVLRSALTRSRRVAIATGIGICCGAFVWGAAAAVGAAALLAASELAYRILTLAGAAYMAYLGGMMLWRTLRRRPAEQPELPDAPRSDGFWRAWTTGAATNLLNPKVGVFYIATIPQFIPAGSVPVVMGLLLAAVHVALTVVWFALLIGAAGLFRRWLSKESVTAWIDRVTGVVLIGFGLKLALERH